METRFRNIRRKPRSSSIGLEFSPPTKKKKIGIHSCPQSSSLTDDATYKLHLKELEKQWLKKTKSKSALSSLMAETSANRHKWIVEEKPSVLEVTRKFPMLKTFDMVCILLVLCIIIILFTAFGRFCFHYTYGRSYEEFFGQLEDLDS